MRFAREPLPRSPATHGCLSTSFLRSGGIVFYLLVRPRRLGGNVLKAKRSSPLGRLLVKTFQTNSVSLLLQTGTLVRADPSICTRLSTTDCQLAQAVIVTKRGTLWYNIPGPSPLPSIVLAVRAASSRLAI